MAQEFAKKKIAPLIFPDGKKWAKNALQANIPACVLSASAAFIVKPIAKLFGLTDAMGIELAFKDGFCTGEIVGIPTFQEGKVERLSQRLAEAGIGLKMCFSLPTAEMTCRSQNARAIPFALIRTQCSNPLPAKTAGKLQSGSSRFVLR